VKEVLILIVTETSVVRTRYSVTRHIILQQRTADCSSCIAATRVSTVNQDRRKHIRWDK